MSDYPMFSTHPPLIARWARECLDARLYRLDGIARELFDGETERIAAMAYLSRSAWVMFHAWPSRFDPAPYMPPRLSAYTRPDLRNRGIMRGLVRSFFPGVEVARPVGDSRKVALGYYETRHVPEARDRRPAPYLGERFRAE